MESNEDRKILRSNKSLQSSKRLLCSSTSNNTNIKNFELKNSILATSENTLKNDQLLINNKLVSISQLKENDFEDNIESTFLVSELKTDAREKIAQLSAGRVSFLLDTDLNLYPKRIFIGESYDHIPYLKITKCPMSPLHEKTIDYEHFIENEDAQKSFKKSQSSGFSPRAYSLYDCIFPNPSNEEYKIGKSGQKHKIGLYKSIETPITLSQTTEKWKSENGVFIDYGSNRGLLTNTIIIGGPYLHKDNIATYSTKYHALILAVIDAVKNGSGKIMIYHHRVKMSGVLLIGEILKMNGFIESDMEPTDHTRCTICGIKRKKHKSEHTFIPARFIVAHSDIDKPSMTKNINQFNSINNLDGHQYKIILGSKIIREGLNFLAVRYQFITSLPTDYPTLVQVFGRVIRKGSHLSLPEDKRNVKIQIFVSTRADNLTSPELQRYINKGKEYLVIQDVEKSLRTNAIDAFANYSKIKEALPISQNGMIIPSLDAIPYKPIAIKEINPEKLKLSTFNAYGYSDREVYVITYILRILFENCPVWTYEDLWKAVVTGQVGNINYNHTLFDKGNFSIALHLLSRPSGIPPKIVTEIGKYFIQSQIDVSKKPAIDIESFIRDDIKIKKTIIIKISNFLSKN